jgi:tRNA dimethylallyltransferase
MTPVAAASPLVAVVGPTASGKSEVAMAAARTLGDVELVSVDAMQVYRGMDIGTAKPSAAERAEIAQHLVDLVDPCEDFTVAEFQREFERVRVDLAVRRRRGILVGGTGLYHRVVIDGLTLPGEWPAVRGELLEEAAVRGTPALHERLVTLDPGAAARMEPTNTRRVVRALEVCIGSGRPFSSFGPGLDAYPPSPVVQIGLRCDRDALARRIEQRVHAMVAAGLVDEVRRLHAAGMSRTAAQGLGYKEIIEHVDGRCSLDEAIAATITRTRQFAVRQERWFRRDPRVRWVRVNDGDPVAAALADVVAALDPTS